MPNQRCGIVQSKNKDFAFDIKFLDKVFATTTDMAIALKMRDTILEKFIADDNNLLTNRQRSVLNSLLHEINTSSHTIVSDEEYAKLAEDSYSELTKSPYKGSRKNTTTVTNYGIESHIGANSAKHKVRFGGLTVTTYDTIGEALKSRDTCMLLFIANSKDISSILKSSLLKNKVEIESSGLYTIQSHPDYAGTATEFLKKYIDKESADNKSKKKSAKENALLAKNNKKIEFSDKPVIFTQINNYHPKDESRANTQNEYDHQISKDISELFESDGDFSDNKIEHLDLSELEKTEAAWKDSLDILTKLDAEEKIDAISAGDKNKEVVSSEFDNLDWDYLNQLMDFDMEDNDLTKLKQQTNTPDSFYNDSLNNKKRFKSGG